MREILFRGKCKETGKWYTGYYINLHKTTYCFKEDYEADKDNDIHQIVFEKMMDWGLPNHHLRVDVIPETIGQYTGLTDKNGKRIFEGDIIKLCREDYDWAENKVYIEEEINIVKFDKGSFYLDFSYSSDGYNEISCLYDEITKNGEVIGNIYDNLELINN